jgi:hypothetical protein
VGSGAGVLRVAARRLFPADLPCLFHQALRIVYRRCVPLFSGCVVPPGSSSLGCVPEPEVDLLAEYAVRAVSATRVLWEQELTAIGTAVAQARP